MQRLSDDEDEVGDGQSPFKDFLVVSHCKNDARPEAFIYTGGSGVNW